MADRAALGEKREVRVPNGTVVYHERGEGQPVVFVHGFLVDGTLWRKVVPLLADDARLITPDWPLGSHRVALKPDADLTPTGLAQHVVDTLDALGIERATLVGNDSGGALSQIVAAEHPDRVDRLILTNCDAFENFPPKAFRYLQWVAKTPGGMAALAQSMRLPGSARSPIAFGRLSNERVPGDVLRGWVEPVYSDAGVRRDAGKAVRGMVPRYTLDAAAKNASFPRPVLLFWGLDDPFFPVSDAERLADVFPDARLTRVEGSRAFVPEDQPEALAAAIREFLAATADSRVAHMT